jgi:hypothetical protein
MGTLSTLSEEVTPAGKRIAVLFHQKDQDRVLSCYVVYHFAKFWREAGYEVIFLFGTREHVPADLILVHVDLSVVPDEYLAFAARYPIVVNGRIKDIRKSTFSQNILGPDDTWEGQVIVKSDLNSAGRPERMLREPAWLSDHPTAHRGARLLEKLSGRMPPFEESRDYKLYDRTQDVPRRYFRDPRLIVERFIPEMENDLYHVRIYQFLGDRATCTRIASPQPVVNGSTTVEIEVVQPHPEIVEWRRRLSIDYGKLDFVVSAGKVVLLDVNKTTGSLPSMHDRPEFEAMRRYRAGGIDSFFRSSVVQSQG